VPILVRAFRRSGGLTWADADPICLVSGLYPVFASWAKKHGLDAAIGNFSADLPPELVSTFTERFRGDLKKVVVGGPPIISAAGQEEWYSGPDEGDVHWPKLEHLFKVELDWSADRVKDLDRSTNQVVAHTPRPDRRSWKSKGLVVGYVQSGKTTNFTSVIAKMADVDYKLVIVLSGIHNGLRRQTQVRLDEQLIELDDAWWPLTDDRRDFHKPTQSAAVTLGTENRIALAVVKKNATVLSRLVEWLAEPSADVVRQVAPVLILDDEADQASVATARINPLIRKLIALMPRCTYVGYTATPFANVFIDPTSDEDLYPRDFILNLPRPDGYFGPEKLFGRDAVEGEDHGSAPDGYDMIRSVPLETVEFLRPVGKSAPNPFVPTLTGELRAAVYWFWLATAARRARGDLNHSSMLVHTSVKTAVQESFQPLLAALQAATTAALVREDAALLVEFEDLWRAETARVPSEDWGREAEPFHVVREHLLATVEATRLVIDNSRSQDRLDYTSEPVTVIAVGGNTLSRGLTLEGLVSSFFVRGASTYDTLMQMGRWFGYRTGYEDLPRIWMTDELRGYFRHLSLVEHELRADIDHYQQQDLTPLDVAVRIKTHPALAITAKMGAARPAYVSYAGRRLQTRFFRTQDEEFLRGNINAASVLVEQARKDGEEDPRPGAYLYRQVPVAHVKAFLESYAVHADSPDLDKRMLLKYIDKQLGQEPAALVHWSVGVVRGEQSPVELGGLSVGAVIRSKLKNTPVSRADIKTLMSRPDRGLDLRMSEEEVRKSSESELTQYRNQDQELASRGLLVLYVIDATSPPERPKDREPLGALLPVIGLGLVFPGDPVQKRSVSAEYVSVDVSDVERDDALDALEQDFEDTEELVTEEPTG
jgi:hypothetical protein